jgi:CrcB protein
MVAVLCGGFCGTITRYLLSLVIQSWLGKGWPYDILLINITGALLLALVTTFADATFLVGPTRRLFINVGFLGAYTTFSSLALEETMLAVGHEWLPAFLYLILSLFGGMSAVVVGDVLGREIIRVAQRSAEPGVVAQAEGAGQGLPTDGTISPDHVDIDDDLLVPDIEEEHLVDGSVPHDALKKSERSSPDNERTSRSGPPRRDSLA